MDAIFRIQYWQAEGKGTFLELLKARIVYSAFLM